MKDPILLNKLYREVEAGRVSVSHSGDLAVFKYTQETHIKDLWNEVNRQARGIIFATDGTVVARPFAKFFNLGERPESSLPHLPKEPYEVWEKMDGSCGIGYRLGEHWLLATPGSMESEQAIEGTKILYSEKVDAEDSKSLNAMGIDTRRYKLKHLPTDCTPVFEIVYPENRIVVDYLGETFLSLLAVFEHNGVEWHPRRVDQIAELCGFHRPRRFNVDIFADDFDFTDNFEGYVVRFEGGLRIKIKSPTYLRIHRLLNYLSPKGVIDLIRGKEYGATVKQLPDAIASDFDDVRAYVQTMHDTLLTAAYERLRALQDSVMGNAARKAQAQWIINNTPADEVGFVFSLLDGKDIEDKIWKLVQQRVKDEGRLIPTE